MLKVFHRAAKSCPKSDVPFDLKNSLHQDTAHTPDYHNDQIALASSGKSPLSEAETEVERSTIAPMEADDRGRGLGNGGVSDCE